MSSGWSTSFSRARDGRLSETGQAAGRQCLGLVAGHDLAGGEPAHDRGHHHPRVHDREIEAGRIRREPDDRQAVGGHGPPADPGVDRRDPVGASEPATDESEGVRGVVFRRFAFDVVVGHEQTPGAVLPYLEVGTGDDTTHEAPGPNEAGQCREGGRNRKGDPDIGAKRRRVRAGGENHGELAGAARVELTVEETPDLGRPCMELLSWQRGGLDGRAVFSCGVLETPRSRMDGVSPQVRRVHRVSNAWGGSANGDATGSAIRRRLYVGAYGRGRNGAAAGRGPAAAPERAILEWADSRGVGRPEGVICMSITRICRKDPLLKFIRDVYAAHPMRVPDRQIKPLTMITAVDQRHRYLGELAEAVLVEEWAAPKLDTSELADIDSRSSGNVSLGVAMDLLSPFLELMLGGGVSMELSGISNSMVSVSLGGACRDYVSPLGVLRALDGKALRTPLRTDAGWRLFVVDSVLSGRRVAIRRASSEQADIGLMIRDQLEGVAAAESTFASASAITISGNDVPFAFTCLELEIDSESGRLAALKPADRERFGLVESGPGGDEVPHAILGDADDFIAFDE